MFPHLYLCQPDSQIKLHLNLGSKVTQVSYAICATFACV